MPDGIGGACLEEYSYKEDDIGVRNSREEKLTHLDDHGHSFLFTPRTFSSPHLQDYTTNAPDVDLCIVTTLSGIHNLRCHPEDSTLHGGEDILFIYVVCPFRDTKVRYLANASLLNQNIIGLKILSCMTSAMEGKCESTRDLLCARYPSSVGTLVQQGFAR